MTTTIGKTTDDERVLMLFSVIIAATKGEPQAMNIVVQHYAGYIAHLSMRKLRDERGNTYYGIDEDMRDRLRSKLMQAVLIFKI
ncbi:helix-turn-helix domain-containing protein [uncultured Megasphaera sp.]|uniref:helix-turn-helix domain-containing protein n=1 Tax=uncultured Megasphaera sp. TaxID=165188 RepID=UPI00259558B0|nr:helix-turn-helix domain-containing protein [uncultured Megasphaera sp.]